MLSTMNDKILRQLNRSVLLFSLALLLLTGCAREAPAPVDGEAAATLEEAPAEDTAEDAPATVDQPPAATAPQATAAQPAATTAAAPTAVPVSFFTPAQQEGPYYPVEKPADRDNDLVALSGAEAAPAGEVLLFGGTVYDAAGMPLENVTIEIWQTDASGVYDHPGDPGTANRDRNFQFYGEAVSDADGRYQFRTIMPGRYEPRPRHIHVKVRVDGDELLTTQFYFADEVRAQGADQLMVIDAQQQQVSSGEPVLVGERDIYLNLGS
jgi:protocatechuate 3,4-dioxygenase beta subunit